MDSAAQYSDALSARKRTFEGLLFDMEATTGKILRSIRSLAGKHNEILSRMKQLQDAGIVYATPHWRQDKYLYLIYPMRKGKRRREYIGSDRYKIKDALAAVKRVDEYELLSQRLSHLENVLSQSCGELNRAVQTIRRG